ncbi:MAG: diguanylate cyclase [Betaproteobacteria bacterium]
MNLNRLMILCAWLAMLAPPVHALDPNKSLTQYRLTQWGVDEGLGHGSVHLLTQDPAGFMWVGTLVGLARFDGVRFVNAVSADEKRVDYFTRSAVFGKTADWTVMGEGGVARRIDHRWQVYPLSNGVIARSLAQRRAGGYWVGSERGVFIIKPGDGAPPVAPIAAEPAGFGPLKPVWFMREDEDGRFWMCTEAGTYLREPDGRVRHLEQEFGLPHRASWMVLRDRQGVNWIGGRNGLIRFDASSKVETHQVFTPRDGLALATVRWIAEDRYGSLWLATPGGGLQRFRDGKFETLRTQDGLNSDSVLSLHVDSSDNVWLGMAGGGVARLSDTPFQVLRKRDGLTGDWVWTIHQDARGDMWIGTNGNGLTVMRGDKAVRRIPGDVQGLDSVWAMHAWDDGRAIVSSSNGIGRVERNDSITWLSHAKSGEAIPRVFMRSADGRLLLAKGSTIMEIRETGIVPTAYPDVGASISQLLETADGKLLVGTRNGRIVAIDRNMQATDLIAPIGFPIFSMKRDAAGRIWASAGGVLILDGNRHVRIGAQQGFPDRTSNDLILANDGSLWVSTNRGIIRTTQAALLRCLDDTACKPPLELLDERDGLVTAETNGGAQPNGWLDRDGRIWLPAINGVIRIDAKAGPQRTRLPNVVIDGMRADRQWLGAVAAVPSLTRDLEIDYTLPELTLPKQVRFRYRLLPDQADWVDVGNRRTAFFASLKPGNYRFEVAAARPHGGWQEVPAVHTFELQAAWYQHWWVRLMAAALLLVTVLSTLWLRFHSLRMRKAELQREVDIRTSELALANRELDRMARTDVLTGIANRREFGTRIAELCSDFNGDGVLAVLIADIDDFKAYNDHYGHPDGDVCLHAVAKAFEQCVKQAGGVACRYGGEEFAAVAVLRDESRANALADCIVDAVRALARPHAHSRAAAQVTLSLGMNIATAPGASAAAMLQRADLALYQAKAAGRDRWVGSRQE